MWGSWLYCLSLEIWLAKLVCWLQGIRLRVWKWEVTRLPEIRAVLKLPQKGYLIEHHLSRDSWTPFQSAESEDGGSWSVLNYRIHQRLRDFQKKELLNRIIQEELQALPAEGLWGEYQIMALILQIMARGSWGQRLSEAEIDLLIRGIQSWRREIALKGPRESELKQALWDWFAQKVGSADPVEVSSMAQPFFISPVINMVDLLIGCVRHRKRYLHQITYLHRPIQEILLEVSYREHPFPFLERYDPRTRTQHLIQMHPLPEPIPSHLPIELMFGSGPRVCPGQRLALQILEPLLKNLLPQDRFHPELGHTCSGRFTQPQSWPEWWLETKTQVSRIGRMLVRLRRVK